MKRSRITGNRTDGCSIAFSDSSGKDGSYRGSKEDGYTGQSGHSARRGRGVKKGAHRAATDSPPRRWGGDKGGVSGIGIGSVPRRWRRGETEERQ